MLEKMKKGEEGRLRYEVQIRPGKRGAFCIPEFVAMFSFRFRCASGRFVLVDLS